MASESAGVGSALPDQTGYSGYFLTTDGVTATWEAVSDTGVTTMAAVGSTANANGASISGFTLTLQPASATLPGVVTAGTQSFGGAKTFASTVAASNLSGTNTGDVTLAAVGSAPSANGATLTAQALNLEPADATHPGVITTGAQTIAGAKIFTGNIAAIATDGAAIGEIAGGFFGMSIVAGGVLNALVQASSTDVYFNAPNNTHFRHANVDVAVLEATSLDLSGLGTGGSIKLKDTVGGTVRTIVVTAGVLTVT